MTSETCSRKGVWAAGGSVVAAAVASACCWLPLLLVALGASASGVSATFERFRPYTLGATAILLGAGFYLVYFGKPKCAPGEACTVPNLKLRRVNRLTLWVATAAVLAFTFFPKYLGLVAGSGPALDSSTSQASVVLDVQGMTCEACTVHIRRELTGVPGVLYATVDYDTASATVGVDTISPPRAGVLVEAVERAGYRASVSKEP